MRQGPQTVNVKQLRENLATYLELAQRGHEVIVTSHGHAVAKIGPMTKVPRIPGILKGKITIPSDDAWDFPDDLTDIMEGKTEE